MRGLRTNPVYNRYDVGNEVWHDQKTEGVQIHLLPSCKNEKATGTNMQQGTLVQVGKKVEAQDYIV
jgi:hypothetical protein